MRNIPIIVRPVHKPIVFNDSRACSTAPVFTSEAMSSILSVASNPGNGRGSSTSHTRLKIMKYMTPRKPANIEATIAIKASRNASPSSNVIKGPSAKEYWAFEASKKMAGNVKMNPVEAWVAPVVADVAMFTSDGDHLSAIPRR